MEEATFETSLDSFAGHHEYPNKRTKLMAMYLIGMHNNYTDRTNVCVPHLNGNVLVEVQNDEGIHMVIPMIEAKKGNTPILVEDLKGAKSRSTKWLLSRLRQPSKKVLGSQWFSFEWVSDSWNDFPEPLTKSLQ